LEVSQECRRQDAANIAKLSAEAANTLSAKIQEVSKLKAELANTKSAYSSQTARHHKEVRLLQNRLEGALIKEQNDHDTHLTTRNQLAKVEHEVQELKQDFKRQHQQTMDASKEALQRQHAHLAAVKRSYEQELEKLKGEHEQDKAHNDGHVCELEAELDALCQERDEQYQKNCDLRERFEEARFDTAYELEEADQKLECLEQILSNTSCELQGVKDEKTQLGEEMVELQATMEETCQQAQDNKVKHEQDMNRAASRRQELEATVSRLVSELGTAKQGNTELRDQLKEVKTKEQEMETREQQLLSQSTADRLMFERTAYALRALLKES
jgi:chromosome segregation ATPase